MINFKFEKVEKVNSSIDYLIKELDENKLDKDKILISREELSAYGSSGRSFFTSKNKGIYFSFLHFYNDNSELKFITQKAAVAVYLTFKQVFGMELSIKWVNDLFFNNKKVCGILCRNLIKYKAVIIGIGIDLFYDELIDESIKDVAGYIFKDKYDLLSKLDNTNLSKESCLYKNVYEDFKTLKIDGIEINDKDLWEPDHIVIEIVMHIYNLISQDGLPKLYIEKNIIKDKKIYEDCELQC